MSLPTPRTARPITPWFLATVCALAISASTLPASAVPADADHGTPRPVAQLVDHLGDLWRACLDGLRGSPGVEVPPSAGPAPTGAAIDGGDGSRSVTAADELPKRQIGPSLDPNGAH